MFKLISKPNLDIFIRVEGQGPAVLFIQGVGVIGHGWEPQTKELSKYFKTITFDNRGIGKSIYKGKEFSIETMVQDVNLILNELGIKSAHIVGHSMGGVIAQKLAIDHPALVKSLALMCTFSKGSQAMQLNARSLWLGLRTRVGTRAMRRKAFLEMLFSSKYLTNQTSLNELTAHTCEIIGRDLADSPPIIMKQLKALARHDSSLELGKLSNIPTLVISGNEDPIARPEFGSDLARRIPGASFMSLENASHGIVLERPDEINKILIEFISKHC